MITQLCIHGAGSVIVLMVYITWKRMENHLVPSKEKNQTATKNEKKM